MLVGGRDRRRHDVFNRNQLMGDESPAITTGAPKPALRQPGSNVHAWSDAPRPRVGVLTCDL
jgi:hypothetical protein